jgi:hypothetical protein
MDLDTQLLADATDYAAARGISLARLATIVVNNGHLFARLSQGGGCTLRTYQRFQAYFAANPVSRPPVRVADAAAHGDAA